MRLQKPHHGYRPVKHDEELKNGNIVLVAGFQGINSEMI